MLTRHRGLSFHASFCLPLTITAEEDPVYKRGSGGPERRSTCPHLVLNLAFSLCRVQALAPSRHYTLTLQGPILRLLCGHQQSLFVLGAGRGKAGRKGPQPVLPGPSWGIKRYSVPPPSSSDEFSSASSALYPLLTTIDQMKQGLCLLHFCIPIYVCRCSMG